jgi:hypothetical protein
VRRPLRNGRDAWLVEQTAQSYLAGRAAVRVGDLAAISRRPLKLPGKIPKRIEQAQPTGGG